MSVVSFNNALLRRDVSQDQANFDAWLQKEAASADTFGSIGGLLGSFLPVLLPTIGTLLAPVTGGASLALVGMGTAATAAWAGVGSGLGTYLGSGIGANQVDDYSAHFNRSTNAATADKLQDQRLADAITNATTAASTSYSLGISGALDPSGAAIPDVTSSWFDPAGGVQAWLGDLPLIGKDSLGMQASEWLGKTGADIGKTGADWMKKGWDMLPFTSVNPNMIPGGGLNVPGTGFASLGQGGPLPQVLQQMNAGPGVTSLMEDIYDISTSSFT